MPKKIPALHRGVALSRSERKQIGPIQIAVIGFDDLKFEGDILPELKRLSDLDVIRLVDMVVVTKSPSGELVRLQAGSLRRERRGATWVDRRAPRRAHDGRRRRIRQWRRRRGADRSAYVRGR